MGIFSAAAATRIPRPATPLRECRLLGRQYFSRRVLLRPAGSPSARLRDDGGAAPVLADRRSLAQPGGRLRVARSHALCGPSLRARRPAALALARAASLGPRSRRNDVGASPSARDSPRVAPLLARRHRARHSGRRAGELWSRRLRLGGVPAWQYSPARGARALVAAGAGDR